MKLAIADPPYPPFVGSGGMKPRASRWYGLGQRSLKDQRMVADFHPAAGDWDDPARHRQLLEDLAAEYDGFAIATSWNGLAAYMPFEPHVRLMVWVKPNAIPGSHRLLSRWEAVILSPAAGRRSNRNGGAVSDVLIEPAPRVGFTGAKPAAWVEWVLAALSYDPACDSVHDIFPGSGAVSAVLGGAA